MVIEMEEISLENRKCLTSLSVRKLNFNNYIDSQLIAEQIEILALLHTHIHMQFYNSRTFSQFRWNENEWSIENIDFLQISVKIDT